MSGLRRQMEEQRMMLGDSYRLARMRKAINEVVRRGDVVLDMGAGSGILGYYACEAGAARVYAVEGTELIELTREIARRSGFGDRIIHLKGRSTRVDLPEKVDVIVADELGFFGFEIGMTVPYRDAVARFLKRGGRVVPSRFDVFVAPVSYPPLWDSISFWHRRHGGFDLSPFAAAEINDTHRGYLRPRHLLGRPVRIASVDPGHAPASFTVRAATRIARAGTMHGIGGFWRAQLSRHVWVTNSPLAKKAIVRANGLAPIERPIKVARGDRVAIEMTILPDDFRATWRVSISDTRGGEKARFLQSWLKGPMSAETLRMLKPDRRPRLNRRGRAERTVLDLADGKHSIHGIECAVAARFGDVIHTSEEARALILGVLASAESQG
jgi:Ribosomal protein L11 methyltransferase (PrmA)